MDRLNANETAVAMRFPANTIKNPHHKPKKKPAPTARIPPGSPRTQAHHTPLQRIDELDNWEKTRERKDQSNGYP